jgi:hypothetical protein
MMKHVNPSMTLIVMGPHTYICIRPNNVLDLSLFPTNGVLVFLPNKQASQI